MTTPAELGYQHALDLIADPDVPTDGLAKHHLARDHVVQSLALHFLAGRESHRLGLDETEVDSFLDGFLQGLREARR